MIKMRWASVQMRRRLGILGSTGKILRNAFHHGNATPPFCTLLDLNLYPLGHLLLPLPAVHPIWFLRDIVAADFQGSAASTHGQQCVALLMAKTARPTGRLCVLPGGHGSWAAAVGWSGGLFEHSCKGRVVWSSSCSRRVLVALGIDPLGSLSARRISRARSFPRGSCPWRKFEMVDSYRYQQNKDFCINKAVKADQFDFQRSYFPDKRNQMADFTKSGKILVLGATGPAGICLLRELIHQKYSTIVYARNPAKISQDIASNALITVCDKTWRVVDLAMHFPRRPYPTVGQLTNRHRSSRAR